MNDVAKNKQKAPTEALPEDFQERVFNAIAVQRPAVLAYIKEVRRADPDATPEQVMRKIEKQYLATSTMTSAAIGASATIPAVGIPAAIGLGVADLLFFYETTALFALSMAELRGIGIDDPERAKALVLGALLGEKRKSKVTELALSALPSTATLRSARKVAGKAASTASPLWGDLLSQQLPDSALVPVTMVLAKNAIAHGAAVAGVKVGSKAVPVIGAVAGGATSYYFGSSVVKSCREGFSAPVEEWPEALTLTDSDGDGTPDPSKAALALRSAGSSAKDLGENVWSKVVDASEVFRRVDLDGDGVPEEARALTAAKTAASTTGVAVTSVAKAVGSGVTKAAASAKSLATRKPRASSADD